MSRRDGGTGLADRLPTPQAAEISCYSTDREITSICADSLVELRGFEPMAIADAARSRVIPLLPVNAPVNARRLFAARLLDLDLRARLGRLSSASARHWSGPYSIKGTGLAPR
jgi:hypothetical protein